MDFLEARKNSYIADIRVANFFIEALMHDNSREFLVHNSLIIWFLAFSLERRSVRSACLKLGVDLVCLIRVLLSVRGCYDERS